MTTMQSGETVTIVLAEDDDGHATLVEKNLVRAGFLNQIIRVTDGQQLLDLLKDGEFAGQKRPTGPFLIVLDVKMPRLDGIEALKQIKEDPIFSKVPVIMLTTTDDPREIEKCYEYGCSVYISKPLGYESFIEAIRRLGLFLEIVQLPTL